MDPALLERRLATLVGGDASDTLLEDDEVLGLFAFGLAQACFTSRRYAEAARWAQRGLAPCKATSRGGRSTHQT